MAESPKSQLHQFDSHFYWKQPLLTLSGALVGELERESQESHRACDLKDEVSPAPTAVADDNKQEFTDDRDDKKEYNVAEGEVAGKENYGSLSHEVVATDSRGWSLDQPKSEKSWKEVGLEGAGDDAEQNGKFIEERLSRLGLGSYGDGAALESERSRIGKFGMGGFKAGLEAGEGESLNVSRSILDECVQVVVGERCSLKKDGFKEIFDADDDEVQEGMKSSNLARRSTWEPSRPSPTPRLAAWLLKAGASEAQVLPEGRAAVAIAANGGKSEMIETRDLVLGQGENLVAAEERVMVDQLRLDLVFPNEAIAAGFCVKIELLQLTLPTALTIARMHVADLGYHLAPVLNEQELLTLAASSTLDNLFSTPLLVDMEDPGTGLQARFFSVVDVNLFLQSRGSKEEHRSLGALRELSKSRRLELGPYSSPSGRQFRVRVDRRPFNSNQLQQFEIASQGPHGAIHLLFRRKQELFHFLFSSGAKQLACVQLEVEDILGREEKKVEEVGVRVRVSWELNLQEPSLSPLPHLITLTPNGLLPLAALLEVTGGRAITGLRYRRLGVRSSEWRSCPREGDMLHPPPGGWSQAADYVVFADRRGVLEGSKGGEGSSDCQVGQRRRCEVEELMVKKMEELEKKLVREEEARVQLEGKVVELERTVTRMREDATSVEENCRRSKSRSLSKDSQHSSSKTSRRSSSPSRPGLSGVRGGECAGVRTRGGLNSSRCVKEIVLDESTLLSFRWRSDIPKCVSNFIKKTPMKKVAEKGGYLVFKLSEQDLDCATLDMISQRNERGMRPRVKMVRNNGRYSLFSETKLQPLDFFHLEGEVQGGTRSLVTFPTKLQMVEALRDPVVQRKYPNLAISKNSILEK